MQKFNKSVVVLYINLIFSIILTFGSILCFFNINETVLHLGMDLYLIFGITLLIFALPFNINLIRYIILPKIVLTINKDEFIIHKRKNEYYIDQSNLLGVSKVNNINSIISLDVGTLKILLRDSKTPMYIRHIDELDKAYQTLNLLIIRNFEYLRKNK